MPCLRLEAFLPDGVHTVAEVVEDVAAVDAAAGGEETADDAGDVVTDVEVFRVVHANAFHAKAEAADTGKDDGLAVAEPLFEDILQLSHYADHRALCKSAVATCLGGYFVERHLALTDGFCKVFSKGTAALDVVPDEFDVYCHNFFAYFLFNVTFSLNSLIVCLLEGVTLNGSMSPD